MRLGRTLCVLLSALCVCHVKSSIIKIGIIVFCLWHMFAVLAYSLPLSAKDPLTTALRDAWRPRVMPYLFATSQWQQWNLFSPDPLRRVTSYILETRKSDTEEWKPFAVLDRKSVMWSALSREMKLLGNIEEEQYAPVRRALLQNYCDMLNLPTGTQMRLSKDFYVLPQPPAPLPLQFWKAYRPQRSILHDTNITCNVTPF